MQLKQKKRIDITDDPLFITDEPLIRLRRLKQRKRQDEEEKVTQSQRQPMIIDTSVALHPIQPDTGRILDYIRVQNRELNQVKLKQKPVNRSRILHEETHIEQRDAIPQVDQFLYRKTFNNIIKRSHIKQLRIEQVLNKVQRHLSEINNQEPSHSPKALVRERMHKSVHTYSICEHQSTERDRAASLKMTMEQNQEFRVLRNAKVKEIIHKTEDTRERSIAAKLIVYSEKPDSIQPTKKQLQQLRYKWIRRLKYNIALHDNQTKQFMAFLEDLRGSDIKVGMRDQFYLTRYREKLLAGDHLTHQDLQGMLDDEQTQIIGKLLKKYVSLY